MDFGWIDDPEAVAAVQETCTYPELVTSRQTDPEKDALGWLDEELVYGRVLDAHNQGAVGSCVGEGFSKGLEQLSTSRIAARMRRGERVEHLAYRVSAEATYALSRVEGPGQGRLRGRDGSVGAWAAKASQTLGCLPRKIYTRGQHGVDLDLRDHDPARARSWGDRGLPDELEDEARVHLCKEISLVTNVNVAREALLAGATIPICSNAAFKTTREEKTGICYYNPRDSWSHCMLIRGCMTLADGRFVFMVQQSWGNTNPLGNREIRIADRNRKIYLPPGGFNVLADDIARHVLPARDSWALFSDLEFFQDDA